MVFFAAKRGQRGGKPLKTRNLKPECRKKKLETGGSKTPHPRSEYVNAANKGVTAEMYGKAANKGLSRELAVEKTRGAGRMK
jgi:hypothetical protein